MIRSFKKYMDRCVFNIWACIKIEAGLDTFRMSNYLVNIFRKISCFIIIWLILEINKLIVRTALHPENTVLIYFRFFFYLHSMRSLNQNRQQQKSMRTAWAFRILHTFLFNLHFGSRTYKSNYYPYDAHTIKWYQARQTTDISNWEIAPISEIHLEFRRWILDNQTDIGHEQT